MSYLPLTQNMQEAVVSLYEGVFAASEGQEEGRLIGGLVSELCSGIDDSDVFGIGRYEQDTLIGAIFFSRLRFEQEIQVYMLSPVAVSTNRQKTGVGQALILHGLADLRRRSARAVVTYGDPSYYSKVGFQPLSLDVIQAPLTLSMPHGWQGLSLTQAPIPKLNDRPRCVEMFNNPVYW